MYQTRKKFNAGVMMLCTSLSGWVLADPEPASESEPAPWYAVQALAGIQTTGECIETMSAVQVIEAVKFGMARIVSEKTSGGKVTQLTFSFQGQKATIYRDKAACEAVARAAYKKQNTVPGRYK